MTSKTEDMVNNPPHYQGITVNLECITLARLLPMSLGNAFKYCYRFGNKWDAIEDLKKAIWYIREYQIHPVKGSKKDLYTADYLADTMYDNGPTFQSTIYHNLVCMARLKMRSDKQYYKGDFIIEMIEEKIKELEAQNG